MEQHCHVKEIGQGTTIIRKLCKITNKVSIGVIVKILHLFFKPDYKCFKPLFFPESGIA
jgi:hypothetical protein